MDRLTHAAERLSGERDDESVGAELVSDIQAIFADRAIERISSVELANTLCELEGRRWAEWSHGKPLTANGLARLLKDYGIQPQPMWLDGRTQRGYSEVMFADAFSRYIHPHGRKDPSNDAENAAPEQAQESGDQSVGKTREDPRADSTPYTLAPEGGEEEANRQGPREPRCCSACSWRMNHYGREPEAGWVCAKCYPDADQAMRGQE